jgi:hypothetical protein
MLDLQVEAQDVAGPTPLLALIEALPMQAMYQPPPMTKIAWQAAAAGDSTGIFYREPVASSVVDG